MPKINEYCSNLILLIFHRILQLTSLDALNPQNQGKENYIRNLHPQDQVFDNLL